MGSLSIGVILRPEISKTVKTAWIVWIGDEGEECSHWIKKSNYYKDRKPRYFNCNIYRHIVKDCKKPKKEKETKKYYK